MESFLTNLASLEVEKIELFNEKQRSKSSRRITKMKKSRSPTTENEEKAEVMKVKKAITKKKIRKKERAARAQRRRAKSYSRVKKIKTLISTAEERCQNGSKEGSGVEISHGKVRENLSIRSVRRVKRDGKGVDEDKKAIKMIEENELESRVEEDKEVEKNVNKKVGEAREPRDGGSNQILPESETREIKDLGERDDHAALINLLDDHFDNIHGEPEGMDGGDEAERTRDDPNELGMVDELPGERAPGRMMPEDDSAGIKDMTGDALNRGVGSTVLSPNSGRESQKGGVGLTTSQLVAKSPIGVIRDDEASGFVKKSPQNQTQPQIVNSGQKNAKNVQKIEKVELAQNDEKQANLSNKEILKPLQTSRLPKSPENDILKPKKSLPGSAKKTKNKKQNSAPRALTTPKSVTTITKNPKKSTKSSSIHKKSTPKENNKNDIDAKIILKRISNSAQTARGASTKPKATPDTHSKEMFSIHRKKSVVEQLLNNINPEFITVKEGVKQLDFGKLEAVVFTNNALGVTNCKDPHERFETVIRVKELINEIRMKERKELEKIEDQRQREVLFKSRGSTPGKVKARMRKASNSMSRGGVEAVCDAKGKGLVQKGQKIGQNQNFGDEKNQSNLTRNPNLMNQNTSNRPKSVNPFSESASNPQNPNFGLQMITRKTHKNSGNSGLKADQEASKAEKDPLQQQQKQPDNPKKFQKYSKEFVTEKLKNEIARRERVKNAISNTKSNNTLEYLKERGLVVQNQHFELLSDGKDKSEFSSNYFSSSEKDNKSSLSNSLTGDKIGRFKRGLKPIPTEPLDGQNSLEMANKIMQVIEEKDEENGENQQKIGKIDPEPLFGAVSDRFLKKERGVPEVVKPIKRKGLKKILKRRSSFENKKTGKGKLRHSKAAVNRKIVDRAKLKATISPFGSNIAAWSQETPQKEVNLTLQRKKVTFENIESSPAPSTPTTPKQAPVDPKQPPNTSLLIKKLIQPKTKTQIGEIYAVSFLKSKQNFGLVSAKEGLFAFNLTSGVLQSKRLDLPKSLNTKFTQILNFEQFKTCFLFDEAGSRIFRLSYSEFLRISICKELSLFKPKKIIRANLHDLDNENTRLKNRYDTRGLNQEVMVMLGSNGPSYTKIRIVKDLHDNCQLSHERELVLAYLDQFQYKNLSREKFLFAEESFFGQLFAVEIENATVMTFSLIRGICSGVCRLKGRPGLEGNLVSRSIAVKGPLIVIGVANKDSEKIVMIKVFRYFKELGVVKEIIEMSLEELEERDFSLSEKYTEIRILRRTGLSRSGLRADEYWVCVAECYSKLRKAFVRVGVLEDLGNVNERIDAFFVSELSPEDGEVAFDVESNLAVWNQATKSFVERKSGENGSDRFWVIGSQMVGMGYELRPKEAERAIGGPGTPYRATRVIGVGVEVLDCDESEKVDAMAMLSVKTH